MTTGTCYLYGIYMLLIVCLLSYKRKIETADAYVQDNIKYTLKISQKETYFPPVSYWLGAELIKVKTFDVTSYGSTTSSVRITQNKGI